jgi:Ca2+-binding RTX toxin-like protein
MAKLIGDQLFPASIADNLVGTADDDYLFGGEFNDTLAGGDGVDSIDGGTGNADWITFAGVSNGVTINLQAVAVPVQPVLVASLQEGSAGVVGFDTTSTIVDDPSGVAGNKVVQVIKGPGALGAAGTTVFTGANQSVDVLPFTADSTTMTLRVYMPVSDEGMRVRLKVENASNNQQTCETDAFTVAGVGWQTLTFDFANAATNDGNPTARLDLDHTFNKVSVFFNFGLSTAGGGGGTFYFDDLTFVKSPDPSGTIANDGFGNSESIANVENVLGSDFADRITGGDGANTLQGAGGNDTIDGGAGNDVLEAGAGNDSVLGGTGNDTLTGGDGNDTLSGGSGIDVIDGGAGIDTVSFGAAGAAVDVTVRSGNVTTSFVTFEEATAAVNDFGGLPESTIVADPAGGSNQVVRVVKAPGALLWAGTTMATSATTNPADPLYLSVGTMPFTSEDTVMTLRVWAPAAGIPVRLKVEDAANPGRSIETEALTTLANGWQTLSFDFADNVAGTPELNPAFTYNRASVFFNFGTDGANDGRTYYFDDLKFVGTAKGSVNDDGFGNSESIFGVENVIGSNFADRLEADDNNNVLSGGGGDDTMIGGGGNDSLSGGTGNDSMVGGAGNDSYTVDSEGDLTVEASGQGTDRVSSSVSFTLGANVENLTLTGTANLNGTGNASANSITGNTGNNVLVGGVGSGTGNDTLNGGDGNDSLSGLDGNDSLLGGNGNDTLNGGLGNDVLVGGTGNDSYVVDSLTDVVSEATTLAAEIDTVTSSVTFTLGSNLERLTLSGSGLANGTGNSLANTITGNGASNALAGAAGNDTLSGGSGNDSLDGGTGTDSLVGGAGNDSYTVDSASDVISETSTLATEIDGVFSTVAWTLGANLENLTIGGVSSVGGTGNALANVVTGNTGNNLLRGDAGNDTLSGGTGNDSLDGGLGNDSLIGGTGNDSYTVDSTTDRISETSTLATEIDTVTSSVTWTLGTNLEKLTLTGADPINGTGNTAANTIVGNSGQNKLVGGTGNDTLNGGAGNDTLDGGVGNDSLIGGVGNDLFVVDSATDRISETSTLATEIDTVSSSVTWTLGANLEKLTLTGSAVINGTGNALANTITGNTGNNKLTGAAGNDTLSGGTGNDTLDGGVGNDALVGGTGADVFRFASALNDGPNIDRITDFSVVDDVLQFENAIFTGLTSTGALPAASFVANTTGSAVDSGDRLLYDTDSGQLFYDADGTGAALKVLVVTLTTKPVLTSADIFVT